MDCDRVQDLLSEYLEDELTGDDRAAVAAHLDGCARCSAEAAGLSQTIALLSTLPREKAPPELLARVMQDVARETPERRGLRGLLSPARVRIPIEAAAAVFLLLLVYGIQREMPVRPGLTKGESARPPAASPAIPDAAPTVPSPGLAVRKRSAAPARAKTAAALPPQAAPAAPAPGADGLAPAGAGAGADARNSGPRPVEGLAASRDPGAAMERPPGAGSAAPSRSPAPIVPAVPAARVSSAEEPIEPKIFAAPPSRMLKAIPFGREVTLEVASGDRAAIAEKIVAAAERLGGGAHPGTVWAGDLSRPPAGDAVTVRLPKESAAAFLDALGDIGTIPPDGMPGAIDLPAGPSPGIVAYTVRIRVK